MKICVFGASGGVGKKIVELALDRGDHVTAVYREKPSLSHKNLTVIVADDVLDKKVIAEAVSGTEAVISALGLRRKNPPNPWSTVVSPPNLTSEFAKLLVEVCQSLGYKGRIVAVSAGGVRDSWQGVARALRQLFRRSSIWISYKDLALMEEAFEKSGLDVVCVRPTTLTNGPLTKSAQIIDAYWINSKISRADVAWFMLENLKTDLPNRTPMITS